MSQQSTGATAIHARAAKWCHIGKRSTQSMGGLSSRKWARTMRKDCSNALARMVQREVAEALAYRAMQQAERQALKEIYRLIPI